MSTGWDAYWAAQQADIQARERIAKWIAELDEVETMSREALRAELRALATLDTLLGVMRGNSALRVERSSQVQTQGQPRWPAAPDATTMAKIVESAVA